MLHGKLIRRAVELVPAVLPLLSAKARWALYTPSAYKTYDYMLTQIERLVKSVYAGNLGGDFIDTMANVISGQLTQAYTQAWTDEEGQGAIPEYLATSLETTILNQYDYVDAYYRSIVDARVD